jgi:hypothetical protein
MQNREAIMQPKTSRDLPPSPPRKDERRDREKGAVKDAAKTDQWDRDAVHGDGDKIGIDKS